MTSLSTHHLTSAKTPRNWPTWSLATQFLAAGTLVSVLAMFLVGLVVSHLIQSAITKNAGATTALYVDSVIAPILPDMRATERLDDSVARALDETMQQSTLGGSIGFFRLWSADRAILYVHGEEAPTRQSQNDAFLAAMRGEIATHYEDKSTFGAPQLIVFYPLLQPWTGEVVAVAELHEAATALKLSLEQAQWRSWAAVALITFAFFLVLSAIVLRGSRTIDTQSIELRQRVAELSDLLNQNSELHTRLQHASERATALNEKYLRRLGSELHDGPAQLVALAALRLDTPALVDGTKPERRRNLAAIKSRLDEALREIRAICTGLVLPDIEAADLAEILERAVRTHEQRTGVAVALTSSGETVLLAPAAKICVYRFVQEGLTNGFQHADGVGQEVRETCDHGQLTICVMDRGGGFDIKAPRPQSLGLIGLRERIESLGGRFEVGSSSEGTILTMTLFL